MVRSGGPSLYRPPRAMAVSKPLGRARRRVTVARAPSMQVLLHIKLSEKEGFLFEIPAATDVDTVLREVVKVNNLRRKVNRLAEAAQQLSQYGPMKLPEQQGLEDSTPLVCARALSRRRLILPACRSRPCARADSPARFVPTSFPTGRTPRLPARRSPTHHLARAASRPACVSSASSARSWRTTM